MQWLLRLLFPPKCILCRRLLRAGQEDLCPQCRREQENWHPGKRKLQFLDSVTAVWYYEGYSRRAVLRFKFYGGRFLAGGLGRQVALMLREKPEVQFDLITWVPVSGLRKLERGYDQSALLAAVVGRELGILPVKLLKKTRHTKRQSSLHGQARRRANVLGAYRAADPARIQGKRILLLDDVATTGVTASECGRVLLTAGAKEVHFAAVAASRMR